MTNFADNRKARFNYEILEELETGIVLTGAEVKSIKAGHISLKEAYIISQDNELWLKGAHVSPYKPAAIEGYNPTRTRKLLAKAAEISHLIGKSGEQGLTIIPTRVYGKNGKIKVEIGLARGKKKYDKKEILKNRDLARDVNREIKERR